MPLVELLLGFALTLVLLVLLLSYAQPPTANPAYSQPWVRRWKSPATPTGTDRLFPWVFLLMIYGFGWAIWAMNQQTHVATVSMIDYLLRAFAAILLAIYLLFVLIVLQLGPRVPLWHAWGVITAPPPRDQPAQEAGERFPHAEPAEPPETPRAETPRPEPPGAR